MSYYHFKPPGLHAHIFLKYNYQSSTKTILLHELTMLKDENEIEKMINTKGLKPTNTSSKIEQEILEKIEKLFISHFSGNLVDLFIEVQKLNVDLDLSSKYKSEF